ncbi:hypothetical protein C9374_012574 [Naegleria lovaniensis]|uniref:Dynein heavy chain n=1 Tax=Naegleria lovaniensis TaxID=51637 RepID=A0AA88H391_NAELO|nr:uncharacterized protein C9374_012574 [Naegleria lovaniensis]KAG2392322.1 hypothetical protein C9374_012574 [Naegleria lovaniensis]
MMKLLEVALKTGTPMLIEDILEDIDPALNDVIHQSIEIRSGRSLIRLGDKLVDYHPNFKLFLTTKLSNPKYSPEIASSLSIINFSVTTHGLEEQLLAILVRKEKPELEEQKTSTMISVASANKQLEILQNEILQALTSDQSEELLENETLISNLQQSKKTSEEVTGRLEISQENEKKIDHARNQYRDAATRASILYFALYDLSNINVMYQHSLESYIELFKKSIENSPKPKGRSDQQIQQRIEMLNEFHTYEFYKKTCQGLFEKHKLLFIFHLCVKLLQSEGKLNSEEYDFFLKGYVMDSLSHHGVVFMGGSSNSSSNSSTTNSSGSSGSSGSGSNNNNNTTTTVLASSSNSSNSSGNGTTMNHNNNNNNTDTSLYYSSNNNNNPCKHWLPQHAWQAISDLDQRVPFFHGIARSFEEESEDWRVWYLSDHPENEHVPSEWQTKIDDWTKMLIVRCVRPDRLIHMIKSFIVLRMGSDKYIKPPPLDISSVYENDSDPYTPIVFLLASNVNPQEQITKLANEKSIKMNVFSLGRGQEHCVQDAISKAVRNGEWIFLANCHLIVNWLSKLDERLESLLRRDHQQMDDSVGSGNNSNNNSGSTSGNTNNTSNSSGNNTNNTNYGIMTSSRIHVHPNFRLWLSSKPHSQFPISLLHRSTKVVSESPSGLVGNMTRLFKLTSPQQFAQDATMLSIEYRKVFFALTYFHSILIEREKFGNLGWNHHYDFNDSDFEAALKVLKNMCSNSSNGNSSNGNSNTPNKSSFSFEAFRYMIVNVCYGGHVTDEVDRKLLDIYARQCFNELLIDMNDYPLSITDDRYLVPGKNILSKYSIMMNSSGQNKSNANTNTNITALNNLDPTLDHSAYLKYIREGLPQSDSHGAFGQNPNAFITSQIERAKSLLDGLLAMTWNTMHTSLHFAKEQQVIQGIHDILSQLPECIDTSKVINTDQPLVIVLLQECERYNSLLCTVTSHLSRLLVALKGSSIMDKELENTFSYIKKGKVPVEWLSVYPTTKPLSSWIHDLCKRVEFFSKWALSNKEPHIFWLSAFTHPVGFLTAVKQIAARRFNDVDKSIDKLDFEYQFVSKDVHSIHESAKDGVYVYGLWLEGAGWELSSNSLVEQKPHQLRCELPVLQLRAVPQDELKKYSNPNAYFKAPLYYCPVRAGNPRIPHSGLVTFIDLKIKQQSVPLTSPVFINAQLADEKQYDKSNPLGNVLTLSDHFTKRGTALILQD